VLETGNLMKIIESRQGIQILHPGVLPTNALSSSAIPTAAPAADQPTSLSALLWRLSLAPSSTVSSGAYFLYHQHRRL
jgi:hypothetical protein